MKPPPALLSPDLSFEGLRLPLGVFSTSVPGWLAAAVLAAIAFAWFRGRRARPAEAREQLRELEAKVQAKTAALEASQSRLMAFIRHASAAITFKDRAGRYLLINPRYAALIGRPEQEILGRTLDQLVPLETCGPWLESERRVLEQGEEIETEQVWVREGAPARTFVANKFPMFDGHGQCSGVGAIITDITERRETERAHLQAQKLESLGILAGGLAHDFNNLLGAMEGNVELARLAAGPEGQVHPYLQTLEGLIGRSASLVQQILAYSGRGKAVIEAMDLNRQVADLTRLLRASLARKATLHLEPDPGLPLIEGDPAQIQQVIMNLVLNAAEAVPAQGGVIALRTGRQDLDEAAIRRYFPGQALAPGLHVLLEVADNGPGMAPEIQERIFDPFFTTKFAGRGLGLSAVLGILRGHRGGIQVRSEPGQGTTFRLLFPAAENAALPAPAPTQDLQEASGNWRGSGTVLLVEDEDPLRATAAEALRHLGFAVVEARDGLEALQLFDQHRDRIRLVLLDFTMPRLDGEQTYRELRHNGMLAPVILTSGFCEMDVLQQFRSKGIAGFLQKPYRLQTLVQLIRKVLDPPGQGPRGLETRKPLAAGQDVDMGSALLDQQHLDLIKAFNQLAAAVGPGGQRLAQEQGLAGLREVALRHFGVEETVMARIAYPRAREHQASHARLIGQINHVAELIRQGILNFNPPLLDFLESWIIHHTQEDDRRLAQYLRDPGH